MESKNIFLSKGYNIIIYHKAKKFESDPWVFCLCDIMSKKQINLGSS